MKDKDQEFVGAKMLLVMVSLQCKHPRASESIVHFDEFKINNATGHWYIL